MAWYKVFGFIKKVFVVAMTVFGFNLLNINSLECVSMNNQECKLRTKIMDVNSKSQCFTPSVLK